MTDVGADLDRLVALMARLRSPAGCPWDRRQTFASLKPYLLEEVYEVLRAVDEADWRGLSDELGDLLLQILFYAQMASEREAPEERFSISDVLRGLEAKLIRRHPHVFAAPTDPALRAEQVAERWEEIKRRERGEPETDAASVLGAEQPWLPALLEAYRLSVRAARAGFEWPDTAAVLDKLQEEAGELRRELQASPPDAARCAAEAGDLLFTAVNVARRLGCEPESALKAANRKFRRRFTAVEAEWERAGRPLAAGTAEELNETWETVKAREGK